MATQVVPSWCKLKSGAWGVKGPGLVAGKSVTLTNQKGNSKSVVVGTVVWTGPDGLVIATLASDDAKGTSVATATPPSSSTSRRSYHERGECEDCEMNADAGDMRGCPRHRGNPMG